jgi:peptidoglycan/LPS O-acetylase OafA/YrhL
MNAAPDKLSPYFSLQLESLRGISAIVVLFTHCFQAFIAPFDLTLYSWVRLLGQAAVMIFFVLSGYLIGYSIQRNTQQHGQFNLRQYTRQRYRRILPPFLFAMALTVILYLLAPLFFASQTHAFQNSFGMMIRTSYTLDAGDFFGSLLFLNGFITPTVSANAPLWSLSYEVWFYVLAGFLPFLKDSEMAKIGFFMVLAILSFPNIQFFIYFLVWLSAFACSFQQVQLRFLARLAPLKLGLFSLAFLIACVDAYQFHMIDQAKIYRGAYFAPFNFCMGLAFCCWLVQLQHQRSHYHPVWIKSANFSYTLYVTHFPLLLFILGCIPATLAYGLGGAVLALIGSMCSLIVFACLMAKWLEPQRKKA